MHFHCIYIHGPCQPPVCSILGDGAADRERAGDMALGGGEVKREQQVRHHEEERLEDAEYKGVTIFLNK